MGLKNFSLNLGSDDSSAAAGPKDPSSTSTVVELFDDFFVGASNRQPYGAMGWESQSNGSSGGNIATSPSTADRNTVGIWRITTGTGVGNLGCISANINSFLFGNSTVTLGYRFKFNTLSDGTDDFISRFGFSNAISSIQHGAIFEYDRATSVNWRLRTTKTNVSTVTQTTTAVDTNWHWIKIVVTNAATVGFYLDGVLLGQHTTNIPTASTEVCGPIFTCVKTAGTLAIGKDIDCAYMRYSVNSARGTF